MSRSGYGESWDDDNWQYLYRAIVDRAIAGKRGQAFLKELLIALDAMPVKELIAEELINERGQCCTIGVVCKARAIDTSKIDCYQPEEVGNAVGIARSMAAEIAYMNDDRYSHNETPAQRWTRMRQWVSNHIKELCQ